MRQLNLVIHLIIHFMLQSYTPSMCFYESAGYSQCCCVEFNIRTNRCSHAVVGNIYNAVQMSKVRGRMLYLCHSEMEYGDWSHRPNYVKWRCSIFRIDLRFSNDVHFYVPIVHQILWNIPIMAKYHEPPAYFVQFNAIMVLYIMWYLTTDHLSMYPISGIYYIANKTLMFCFQLGPICT